MKLIAERLQCHHQLLKWDEDSKDVLDTFKELELDKEDS